MRPTLADDLRQCDPVHVGHGDIGKQRGYVVAHLQHRKRLNTVPRFDDVESLILKEVQGEHSDKHLVFHDENNGGSVLVGRLHGPVSRIPR